MKTKMTLWREGVDVFEKIFDWGDLIKTNNGEILVKEISVFNDKLIIHGDEYSIIHMLSANDFNNTLTANPHRNDYGSVRCS